jgi:trans-aconitate methyltransferase
MAKGQEWSADDYARHGRFVADLAGGVLAWLDPQPGERILDLGCGDGALTEKLVAAGARVLGVDASESMIAAAAARGLDVRQADGQALDFRAEFDAVFSNAALHWMPDAAAVAAGVHRALVPGGRFVAEFGGHGNIAAVRTGLRAVAPRYGLDRDSVLVSYFPTPAAHRALLEASGFVVDRIELIARPTPLANGLPVWIRTFRASLMDELGERAGDFLAEVDALVAPVLTDETGTVLADYVRLRFAARKE